MTDYELQSQINNETKIHCFYNKYDNHWLVYTYNLYEWNVKRYNDKLEVDYSHGGPNYSLDYNMPQNTPEYKQLIYGVWNDFDIKEAIKLVG